MTAAAPAPPATPAPRSRGLRRLVVVLVIVAAVLALLFAVDRGLQTLAERRIATEVQTTYPSAGTPSVDLGSFPFLHEVVTGRVQTARLQVDQLEIPDTEGATATDLDATFADITLSDGFRRVVAGAAQATGTLSYASLSTLSGLEMTYAAPDRVSVAFDFPLGRQTVSGTAVGRPVLDAPSQSLAFEDVEVTVPGSEGDQAVLDAAGRLVLRAVPLGELPYDLQVTDLDVTESGVRFAVSGTNLPLRG